MRSAPPNPYLVRFAEEHESVPQGQRIFSEGEPGDVMYVVTEGEVDLVARDTVIETLAPGDILGEMALIDKNPRSATAIARTNCRLAPINEARFTYLVQQTPYFAIQVMRVMAHRLRSMDEQLSRIGRREPRQRGDAG